MLLKRLTEQADQRDRDLPPPYYSRRVIHWYVELDDEGRVGSIEPRRLNAPGDREAVPSDCPYVYRSGQRPPATLLVDTLQYAIGLAKDDSDKQLQAAEARHAGYRDLIERWAQANPGDAAAQAVLRFVKAGGLGRLIPDEQAQPSDLFAIRVSGRWAHELPSAISFWRDVVRERKSSAGQGTCLVCGEVGVLLDTLPESIKGGAIPAGSGRSRDAQIVSVNSSAQGRGGKIQLANTPICDVCGNRSIAALNLLLGDDTHRWRRQDSVLVWWLRKPEKRNPIAPLRDQPPTPAEVRAYLKQVGKGSRGLVPSGPEANYFYAVTLSVNQSRVVVRDWIDVPLDQAVDNVMAWFGNHMVVDRVGKPATLPLWRLVNALGRWDATSRRYVPKSVPHSADRQLLAAALRGRPIPAALNAHLLQRIRADGHLDVARMALIRLFLNQFTSSQGASMPELNPDYDGAAYRCGRTFAVLEALQRRALGKKVNSTVVDRLFRRAVVSPRSALIPARKTASGHLRKLRTSKVTRDQAAAAALDARLVDVWPGTLPAVLDLEGQDQFLAGYHHQRAADLAAAIAAKARRGTRHRSPRRRTIRR